MEVEGLKDVFEEGAKEDDDNAGHAKQGDWDAERNNMSHCWTSSFLCYHHVRIPALQVFIRNQLTDPRLLGFCIPGTGSRSLSSRDPTFVRQRLHSLWSRQSKQIQPDLEITKCFWFLFGLLSLTTCADHGVWKVQHPHASHLTWEKYDGHPEVETLLLIGVAGHG